MPLESAGIIPTQIATAPSHPKSPQLFRIMLLGRVFDIPEDDRFMTIDEYDKSNFVYGENFLGIARDDDLVII